MPDARLKTVVLISGRGSNLAALIGAARDPNYPAEITLVVSDSPDAGGLDYARAAGVPFLIVDRKAYASKLEFEIALDDALHVAGVDLVCLAGFMRLLSAEFVNAWRDRMLNIHPSLLPLFPGLNTHERALSAGMRLHGATVHFVRPEMDQGPIVAQAAVPVVEGDTAASLAARVLSVEHRLYPLALELVASGRARAVGERVVLNGENPAPPGAALLSPSA